MEIGTDMLSYLIGSINYLAKVTSGMVLLWL